MPLINEKTNNLGTDQVQHKPGCIVTEDGYRLEILDLEVHVEEFYYPCYLCGKNKGADQLRAYAKCWFSDAGVHFQRPFPRPFSLSKSNFILQSLDKQAV